MDHVMRSDLMGGFIGSRDHEPRLPRFKNIRSKSAVACFQPGVSDRLEAERFPPVVHGMFGVPHIEMNVIDGFDLQEIRFLRDWAGFCLGNSCSHSASFSWSTAALLIIH